MPLEKLNSNSRSKTSLPESKQVNFSDSSEISLYSSRSTASENLTINKTLYAGLPKIKTESELQIQNLSKDGDKNDELLEALHFLRNKIKNLNTSQTNCQKKANVNLETEPLNCIDIVVTPNKKIDQLSGQTLQRQKTSQENPVYNEITSKNSLLFDSPNSSKHEKFISQMISDEVVDKTITPPISKPTPVKDLQNLSDIELSNELKSIKESYSRSLQKLNVLNSETDSIRHNFDTSISHEYKTSQESLNFEKLKAEFLREDSVLKKRDKIETVSGQNTTENQSENDKTNEFSIVNSTFQNFENNSSKESDNPLPTPRQINSEISEKIKNRISNILRPPFKQHDETLSIYNEKISSLKKAGIFEDEDDYKLDFQTKIDLPNLLNENVPNENSVNNLANQFIRPNELVCNSFTEPSFQNKPISFNTLPKISYPTLATLNSEIESQLKSADERCMALEKQLDEMKFIVQKTTQQSSLEIENIIENSRNVSDEPKSTNKILLSDKDFIIKVMDKLKAKNLSKDKLKLVAEKLAQNTNLNSQILQKIKNIPKKETYKSPYKYNKPSILSNIGSAKVNLEKLSKRNSLTENANIEDYNKILSKKPLFIKDSMSNTLRGTDLQKVRNFHSQRPKTAKGDRKGRCSSVGREKSKNVKISRPSSVKVNSKTKFKSAFPTPSCGINIDNQIAEYENILNEAIKLDEKLKLIKSDSSSSKISKGSSNKIQKIVEKQRQQRPNFYKDTFQSKQRRKINNDKLKFRKNNCKHPEKLCNPVKTKVPKPVHIYTCLKLAEIPFINGKSSKESYNTGANIQQLMSDVKNAKISIMNNHARDRFQVPDCYSKKDLYKHVKNLRCEIKY